jgi:RecF/RecN/SMC N terminal domain
VGKNILDNSSGGWQSDVREGRQSYYQSTGYKMINSIIIHNFRCFKDTRIDNCRRLNVIVGDNGSGKTALLEAIFLTLSGSMEVSLRFRQQRGLDGAFSGTLRAIEQAIWRDYFYNLDWNNSISVKLLGSGDEARSLDITRAFSQLTIPLDAASPTEQTTGPLVFNWTDAKGKAHLASPGLSNSGLQLAQSTEDLPDFFYMSAGTPVGSVESATRFSEIRQARRDRQFVATFTKEYDWIEDLSIEVSGGSPVIHAAVKGINKLIPVANVSGGINRALALLLTIASRPRSVVLVDEIEAGLYYRHLNGLWKSILSFAHTYDSQLFVTTHSEEWLEALVDTAEPELLADIALWRIERTNNGPVIRQFSGKTLRAGIETGGEVR